MMKVLHITQAISAGGANRCAMAAAKHSLKLGNYQHFFAGLLPPGQEGLALASASGMSCLNSFDPATIKSEILNYDLVHIHWWNNPQLDAFLRSGLPPCRLLIWFHVGGQALPQIVTNQLVDFADFALAGSPYTYECPAIQRLDTQIRSLKTGMAYDPADFDRLAGLIRKPHQNFNIGFIGTVDYLKMHPQYLEMSAAARIPNVKFVVCGSGAAVHDLTQRSQSQGIGERFDIRGYVSDIRPFLETMDVYGYPLCEENYSAAELNLQEVMYVGIPPVVFPYGGIKRLVYHEQTGLVVNSSTEYTQALEHLYHEPLERERLGGNAARYARQYFGGENSARIIHEIYQKLMLLPRQEHKWGQCYNSTGTPLITTTQAQSPAEIFIETLGRQADDFKISLTATELKATVAADERISLMSKTMQMTGVLPYKNYYPNDFHLRLWAGLSFWGAGAYEHALTEYSAALQLNNPHWRVLWYFALAAIKLRQWQLADNALEHLVNLLPDFKPAASLKAEIASQDAVLLDNGLLQINLQHQG